MSSNPLFAQWTRRLFWLAVIVLILILIGSGFFIYQYFQSRGLSLNIEAQTEVNIGVPFNLTVNFSNQSRSVLNNAKLNLNLPDGVVILGAAEEQRIISKDLGDIGIGSLSSQSFQLLVVKDSNTLKRLTASISYGTSGIGQARFEQHRDFDLAVKEPGVSLNLTPPIQILSGGKFDINIDYQNISQENFSGLEIQVDYPASFSFVSADIKPDGNNNIWKLKDLAPNSKGSIVISGQLIGPANSFFNFDVKLSQNIFGHQYVINEKSASLTILSSPLELIFSLNNQENYISQLGDQLNYTLSYQNNSGVGLADAVIKAKLVGDLFNFSTLKTNANFNSITNTLTWNASNLTGLKVLPVGDSGSVSFQINVKNQFPIRRLSDKNYSLKVEAEIDSPTVSPDLAVAQTTGLANLETKVAGAIGIQAKAYFRDAASGLLNSGPWPPKVNQATRYTIHWLITNYATDVSKVEVRAFLESGVRFTGQVKGNTDSLPTYNDRTQEVVWTINKISATKGVISQPLEAIFQIEAVPNINQVQNYQPLIQETSITASDDFTGKTLQSQAAAITTALPDDLTVSQIKGTVSQ
ncbi:MAG: hypothetical protein Q8N22_03455 [bacterium]|nr:hypothetical protein [bacterium]